MTYDPTAKAEALSRLIRSLCQEAEKIESLVGPNAEASGGYTGPRYATLRAEIAYLEIVLEEWHQATRREKPEIPEDQGWYGLPPHPIPLEKIPPPDIEAKEGGQGGSRPPESPLQSPSEAGSGARPQRPAFGAGSDQNYPAGAIRGTLGGDIGGVG